LAGIPDAPVPKTAFAMGKLLWTEFQKKLKSRKNKSSPGHNGVPYVVFKRCEGVARVSYRREVANRTSSRENAKLHG
jgi:hypothetical protein